MLFLATDTPNEKVTKRVRKKNIHRKSNKVVTAEMKKELKLNCIKSISGESFFEFGLQKKDAKLFFRWRFFSSPT